MLSDLRYSPPSLLSPEHPLSRDLPAAQQGVFRLLPGKARPSGETMLALWTENRYTLIATYTLYRGKKQLHLQQGPQNENFRITDALPPVCRHRGRRICSRAALSGSGPSELLRRGRDFPGRRAKVFRGHCPFRHTDLCFIWSFFIP